jgi:hypothetical protein
MVFRDYSDVAAALAAESKVWSAGQGHSDAEVRQNALAAREWWANYQAPPSAPSYSPPSPAAVEVYVAPPPPPKPPDPWIRTQTYGSAPGVKQADPDIVIFNEESLSPELLLELGYEDLSGIELINISRSDIIDGQNVSYTPVKQLSSLRRRYNPNNLISLPELSSSFFSRFQIELFLKDVQEPYFNENGDLVIELRNVLDDEIVEVEIDTSGTINEVDFL